MTNAPHEGNLGYPGDMPHARPDVSMGRILADSLQHTNEDPLVASVRLAVTQRDAEHQRAETWRERATTDSLTGLANRLGITQTLESLVKNEEGTFAVMFLDVDGLKGVNDTEGHEAGDELIKSVADVLRGSIRTKDEAEKGEPRPHDIEGHPARLAGDEFVLVFRGVSNHQQLGIINNRIIDNLEGAGIKASTGAALHAPGQTAPQILKLADEAMFQDKRERKAEEREQRKSEKIASMSPEDLALAMRARNLLGRLSMTGTELDDIFGE